MPDYKIIKDYLIKIIPKHQIRSVFVVGSIKNKIELGSDIDIVVIVKPELINRFLDSLTKNMDKFVKEYPEFIFSYFHGPIKFENKKLIHFLIYTDKGPKELQSFQKESPQMFENFLRKYILLIGEDCIRIKSEMCLNDQSRDKRKNFMRQKSELFWEQNKVSYKEWIKKGEAWKFEKSEITLNPWQKRKLEGYFLNYKNN